MTYNRNICVMWKLRKFVLKLIKVPIYANYALITMRYNTTLPFLNFHHTKFDFSQIYISERKSSVINNVTISHPIASIRTIQLSVVDDHDLRLQDIKVSAFSHTIFDCYLII